MQTIQRETQEAVPGARVIEVAGHPLIARVHVLPETEPGTPRPKVAMPYLSPSQIKKYTRCNAQYMFSYYYKLREPDNSALLFGKALHAAQEAYLRAKRLAFRQGSAVDHDRLRGLAQNTARTYARGNTTADMIWKDQWTNGPQETLESLIDGLGVAVEIASDNLWKTQPATGIEQGFLIEWRRADVLPMLGFADTVEENSTGQAVRDLKTGKEKKLGDAKLDNALTVYAQGQEIASGRPVRTVGYDSYVRNKTPKLVRVDSERTDEDFIRVYRIAQTMTFALQKGVYLPTDDLSKCGNPVGAQGPERPNCAFYGRCRQEFGTLTTAELAVTGIK